MSPASARPLIDRLPAVRGRLREDAPLAGMTWFRVGGPAEILFKPADSDDLAAFLAARPKDAPFMVMGVGSNLLVRDGGVPGIVIRLGAPFARIDILEGHKIRVGAGALDQTLAETACQNGIGGLEFLSGIPGTIGGALCMNAGAFGGETKDVTIEVRALDQDGILRTLSAADMGFSYRKTAVPEDWVFIDALFQGHAADPAAIAARMQEIQTIRDETQPVHGRTGGSTFANPEGASAWKLIDDAGCRGMIVGGACVSDKHCNFLLNVGGATAADIETLGEEIRRRVRDHSGHELRWEIRRVGIPAAGQEQGLT